MKFLHFLFAVFCLGNTALFAQNQNSETMIRIAHIQVKPEALGAYLGEAQKIAETSVRKEAGVLALLPMQNPNEPTHFTVFEVYANEDAYQKHLQTEHFKTYKTRTQNMVLSLQFSELEALSGSLLSMIFQKQSAVPSPAPNAPEKVADVHNHIILPEYLAYLKKHHALMDEKFPLPNWEAPQEMDFLKDINADFAVLTAPAPQPYFGSVQENATLVRLMNEKTAALKSQYPNKIKFCATLPLPDVPTAVQEAIYALDTLHADGVKLATNSHGQYLGDPDLDPLFEELNKRKTVIIIHPHRPEPYPESVVKNTPLAIYEYPAETTRAVLNMISRNLLVRYPNLKIVVPHCGSFLPLAVARAKAVYPIFKARGLMPEIDFEGNLAQLYYDLAGNPTEEVLNTLLNFTDASHILYGSDFPYVPKDLILKNLENLKKILSENPTFAPHKEAILHENAKRIFP